MIDEPKKPSLATSEDRVIPLDPDQRVIEQIEYFMANPPPEYVTVKMTITPGAAAHIRDRLLAHNRNEKPSSIRRFARDMAKPDGWKNNGSTVVFTDQHLLGDGKNRILACCRADRPFTTAVMFNVPHENFDSMDQGRVRTGIDLLEIEGVKNPGPKKQAVRWLELIATKPLKAPSLPRTTFDPRDILKLYKERYSDVGDLMTEARDVARHRHQPVGLVLALLYLFVRVDKALAADFAASWAGGPYEKRFQPITTMEIEIEQMRKDSAGRVHEVVRAAMIINAWNAVREGKKGRYIRWHMPTEDRPGVAFPDIK